MAVADSARDLMKPAPGEISASMAPGARTPARQAGDPSTLSVDDGRSAAAAAAATAAVESKKSGIPLINFNQFMTSLHSIKDCVVGPSTLSSTAAELTR